MTALQRARSRFVGQFGAPATYGARAPGRLNLIGDHTDYADGFVLPMAIDRDVVVVFRPRADGMVVVVSEAFPTPVRCPVHEAGQRLHGWGAYVQGVVGALRDAGHELVGVDAVVASDVPVGAGLSSSAALELAVARALTWAAGSAWDGREIARLCQRAENDWVGVSSGVMDQLIGALGVAGCALLVDCRSLGTSVAPVPDGWAVVACDTGTNRALVDSAYNDRRRECAEAAARLGVPALRDAAVADLDRLEQDVLRRRARHVVTENARTLALADALHRSDATAAGTLMAASHASLRSDFDASSAALDAMIDSALRHPDCIGARMTGAGWGGSAVALVTAAGADDFVRRTAARYRAATGHEPNLRRCRPAGGARLIEVA